MLIITKVIVLMIEWEHEALWDGRAAEALEHAVGNFSDNPASSFILADKSHVSVVDG